jgi:hypothetical protein
MVGKQRLEFVAAYPPLSLRDISPTRGEVAAKLRVGVIVRDAQGVTPPRRFAPTLPLKGRVDLQTSAPGIPPSLDDLAGALGIDHGDLAG